MDADPLLRCENLYHVFERGKRSTIILDGLNLSLDRGEMLCIGGRSGAGKSTLLNCIAGLQRPDRGKVFFRNRDIYALGESARARLRSSSISMVFQSFQLLTYLSVSENLILPGLLSGRKIHGPSPGEMLERVGLKGYGDAMPRELSGGERQRVALARALLHRPALLLCDEITANLDPETAGDILNILQELLQRAESAVLAVTHNPDMLKLAHRRLRLKNGSLEKW